jgi:hypothetical protein
VPALVQLIVQQHCREGGVLSDRRLPILVDAAINAGAPTDYVDWLNARPSNPPSA